MVIGQYKILEKIGEGGMGTVYKAEHVTLEQVVALKFLLMGSNEEMRERFIREAKILAKLNHVNIVTLHNFFEHENNFYLVMEFVDGDVLDALVRTQGPLSPDVCTSIFMQVLSGVGFAHSRGIVHRDIKPRNIMINTHGVVKVTDFGIAKISDETQKTRTGIYLGTLYYMSPEQLEGKQAGVTSDIYSLGVTLFQMATGRVPFTGDSEYHVMKAIMEAHPPSPRDFSPETPEFLERAILKAIARSPADRFQSTAEFMEALGGTAVSKDQGLLDIQTVLIDRSQQKIPPPPEKRQSARNKKIIFGLCGVLLLALAIFFIYLGFSKDKAPQAEGTVPAQSVPKEADARKSVAELPSAAVQESKPIAKERKAKVRKKTDTGSGPTAGQGQLPDVSRAADEAKKETKPAKGPEINAGSWGKVGVKE
jgi:serine/threonine protein kinase